MGTTSVGDTSFPSFSSKGHSESLVMVPPQEQSGSWALE